MSCARHHAARATGACSTGKVGPEVRGAPATCLALRPVPGRAEGSSRTLSAPSSRNLTASLMVSAIACRQAACLAAVD